jgi:DNA-binding NarL/FixJ family response regulator
MTEKKKIFIVDDHPVLRDGLTEMINRSSEGTVCGDASTAEEALERVPAAAPDLVVVDLSLPGMNGIELVKALRARLPSVRILVLSMHDEALHAERAMRAGARGYIMKHHAAQEILEAIRKVLSGDLYLSPQMSQQVLETAFQSPSRGGDSPVDILSEREREVFALVGKGSGPTEIARQLGLNVKTVETYQARMKEKLKAKDSAQLYQMAQRWVQENEPRSGGLLG